MTKSVRRNARCAASDRRPRSLLTSFLRVMSARRRLRQPSGIRETAVLVTNNLWDTALGVNRLNNNRRGGFMPIRKAEAEWKGNLVQGRGRLKVGSGAFAGPYSFKSRLEEGQSATNPEELIGAAHAGCFTMALTAQLSQAGIAPNRVHTIANVTLDKVGESFAITRVELRTEADIPGIDDATFQRIALDAKQNCPVSKALAGTEIDLTAKLLMPATA